MTTPGKSIRFWSAAFLFLLALTSLAHFAFFKIDRRPTLDHDGYYYRTTIPLYRSLEKQGIGPEFLSTPFSRRLQNYGVATYPPLPSMAMALIFHFFGPGLFLFKMVNLIFFLLLLFAAYLIANRIAGPPAGFFSAFVLATLPAMIQHARKNNLFFPETALFLLAVYFFLAGENFTRRKYAVGFGLTCLAMLLTHYIGLSHLLAFALFYFLTGGFCRRKIVNGLLILLICALAVPWYSNYLPAYMAERAMRHYPFFPQAFLPRWFYLQLPKNSDFVLPVYFNLFQAVLPLMVYCAFKSCGRGSGIRSLLSLFFTLLASAVGILLVFKVGNGGQSMIALAAVSAVCSVVVFLRQPARFSAPVRLALVAVVLANGIYIMFWPLLRTNLSVRASIAGRFCDQRLDKKIFGAKANWQSLNNYLLPYQRPVDTLEEVLEYFRDKAPAGQVAIRCCPVNIDVCLADFLYNGFLQGLNFELSELGSKQPYEYCLFLVDDRNTFLCRGEDVELTYEYQQKNGKTTLRGFTLERRIPVSWHDFRQTKPFDGALYIFSRKKGDGIIK